MKGGGIKRAAETWYPTFLGALLDILPRCVDRKENNGKITRGIYSDQLTEVMGEGAFDEDGHRSTQFLRATKVGPYQGEMQKAWEKLRDEAAANFGFQEGFREGEARGEDGTSGGADASWGKEQRSTRKEESEESGGLRRGR